MRRLICALLALLLAAAGPIGGIAESADGLIHNYILIIDNSRSTTGRHSLGGATDPSGLRFDAAKLVYENVLASAETGSRGKIGVVVFCGPENCVSYGPMDINAEPDALDEAIGSRLNAAANRDRRDNYTDIRTALETARGMMLDIGAGDTSLILLTDGVNDLINLADPFGQPENIEANDQSVAIVEELHGLGADFYVIALTAPDAIQNTDAFMAFIDRMAAAGGGVPQADGAYSNVLMATQADLNSKLLQMLIRAESAAETNIPNIIGETPVRAAFSIPYEGISSMSINITFMPEDKPRLRAVELISPDGAARTLYDGEGAHPQGGVTVTEDRSYIILGVPSPQPGQWQLAITGEEPGVPINAVVRFDHKLRLRVGLPEGLRAGMPGQVEAWLQQYDGAQYVDLEAGDLYRQSAAVLTLSAPDGRTETVDMTCDGSRYTAAIRPDMPGVWSAEVDVRNDYWEERTDEAAFEVLPAPTEAPTPEPAAGNAAADSNDAASGGNASANSDGAALAGTGGDGLASAAFLEDGTLVVDSPSGSGDLQWFLKPDDDAREVAVSWAGEQAESAGATLVAEGSDAPLLEDLPSGSALDLSALDEDIHYTLLLTAFTGEADAEGTPPPMQALELQLVPEGTTVEGITLQVADIMMKIIPTVLNSPDITEDLAQSMQALQEGAADATAGGASPDSGGDGGSVPSDAALPSQAQGDATQSQNSAAQSQNALAASGAAGGRAASQGAQSASAASEDGDAAAAPASTDAASPAAVDPADAPEAEPSADAGSSPAGLLDWLKANWIIPAGGVAALALLIAVLLVAREMLAEKVSGSLRVTCDAIKLSMLLHFEGSGRIKVGSPLTRHPDVAKLKGGKVYDVLSNLTVGMATADHKGLVPGYDGQFRPDEPLIRVTCTDPRSGEQQTCYVSKYDVGDATLQVYDAGRTYALVLSGSLSFDELLYRKG